MLDTRIISLLLQAPGSSEGWNELTQEIPDRLKADLCILSVRTPINGDPGNAFASNGHASPLRDWVATLPQSNLLTNLRTSDHDPATCRLDHTRDTTTDPATRAWANSNGFKIGMHGISDRANADSGCLSVFRRERDLFTEADEEFFQTLLVPLAGGMSAQRKIDRAEDLVEMARSILNTMFVGAVVTGRDRLLVHANDMAVELLEEGDAIRIEGRRFSISSTVGPKIAAEFSRQLEQASEGTSPLPYGATASLSVPRAGRSDLSIISAPLAGRPAQEACRDGHPIVITYLSVPERFTELAASRLQAAYGLTTAEVDLAISLANGKSLRQAAAESGRSEATLRKQLQSVFTKTKTHRQSELVSQLLRRVF